MQCLHPPSLQATSLSDQTSAWKLLKSLLGDLRGGTMQCQCFVMLVSGIKIHTFWCLEKDWECVEPLEVGDETLELIDSLQDVEYPTNCLLIMDDYNTEWWRPIISRGPVDVMCISPPSAVVACSKAAGLQSLTVAILQTVDYIKATGSCCCL